jgi:hypothetical protein
MKQSSFQRVKRLARNEPGGHASLDGWRLSDHALDRLLQRHPDLDDLRLALSRPVEVRVWPDGRRYQEYGDVAVVLAPDSKTIVTVVTGVLSPTDSPP